MQTDKEIFKRLKEGDPDAFELVFEKYHRKVYTFALRNFRNKEDAEEAVQDVFYNLWKDRRKLEDVKEPEAWIFSIVLNIIRKHFRKLATEKKYLNTVSGSLPENDSSTLAEVEYRDLLEKTERIIENLPPRQRDIFLLSRKESMSNPEIAEKLGISVRTVDNQLSRAKTFIREALDNGNLVFLLFFYLFIY